LAQKSILVKQQQSFGSEEYSCEANNNLLARTLSTLVKQQQQSVGPDLEHSCETTTM
jgi:hypothetical protein